MRTPKFILFVLGFIISISVFTGCYYDNEEYLYPESVLCDTTGVTYSGTIAPVMATNCNGCHGGAAPSGGIATDNYAAVKANMAQIWGAINHSSGYQAMPQNSPKLSNCNLAKILAWKNAGMPNN